LAEHDGVEMLVLFGSLARGDEGTDSDVDLIVDGPVTKDVAARTLLRGRLIEELGRSVELMSIDEARRAPEVLLGAVRDGHVIKDLTGRWPALLRDSERIEAEAHAEHRTYPARKAAALARLREAKRG
jgi:predicted nucleotidyltransferase